MFNQCINSAFYVVLIRHYSTLTFSRVLLWKAKPGNVVYWHYLNVRLSLSLCLPCSAVVSRPYRLSLTRSGSWEHPRALEEIQDLRGGEDEEISPHRSTTMQILGVSFLLFWLIWGHSCALGGKGRHIKKRKRWKKINLASNCSFGFFAFELHNLARVRLSHNFTNFFVFLWPSSAECWVA